MYCMYFRHLALTLRGAQQRAGDKQRSFIFTLTSHASPALGVWVHFILHHLSSLQEHTHTHTYKHRHHSGVLLHAAKNIAGLYQSQGSSESLLVTAAFALDLLTCFRGDQ